MGTQNGSRKAMLTMLWRSLVRTKEGEGEMWVKSAEGQQEVGGQEQHTEQERQGEARSWRVS